jgi:hypothetical protein
MNLLLILSLLAVSGCTTTVTVEPLKAPTPSKRSNRSRPRHAVTYSNKLPVTEPKSSLVDSRWIDNYKQMEKEHGYYTVPDDANIKSEGGKFRVSKLVKEHYQDMLLSKPTATPIQTNP